jgi:signal transduction histidine kinase
MIENLLELARLDARQVELHRRWIPLRAFLAECWRAYADRASARGVRFTNEIAAEAALYTDRDKLRIVVNNLLANAAEYTVEGGEVVVRAGAEPDVVLDIADSGPAIAEEALPRIFDRLYRKDPARTGTGAHCGIGLALVKAVSDVLELEVSAANLADGSVRFRLRARRPPEDPAQDSPRLPHAA